MQTSYIVTFIGDDRPGLVERLSAVIESNGGNWHESRLSQLGGKFAGLILVSLPTGDGAPLESELSALAASGISVRVTPVASGTPATAMATGPEPDSGRRILLSVIGPDRRGIVREISQALAQRQINVVEMVSEVQNAPMSAEAIFRASIDALIPENANLEDLWTRLDEIADNMALEIDMEAAPQ